jgi:hypothetical protein
VLKKHQLIKEYRQKCQKSLKELRDIINEKNPPQDGLHHKTVEYNSWIKLNNKIQANLLKFYEKSVDGTKQRQWEHCVGCENKPYAVLLEDTNPMFDLFQELLLEDTNKIGSVKVRADQRRNKFKAPKAGVLKLSVDETTKVSKNLKVETESLKTEMEQLTKAINVDLAASKELKTAGGISNKGIDELKKKEGEKHKLDEESNVMSLIGESLDRRLMEVREETTRQKGKVKAKSIAGFRGGFLYQYVDVIVAFLYTGILRCLTKALACESPDYSHLIAVPAIECWTGLHLVMVPAAILGLVVLYPAAMLTRPLFQALNENLDFHFDYNYLFVFSQLQTFLLVLSSLIPESTTILVLLCLFVDLVLFWYFCSRPERDTGPTTEVKSTEDVAQDNQNTIDVGGAPEGLSALVDTADRLEVGTGAGTAEDHLGASDGVVVDTVIVPDDGAAESTTVFTTEAHDGGLNVAKKEESTAEGALVGNFVGPDVGGTEDTTTGAVMSRFNSIIKRSKSKKPNADEGAKPVLVKQPSNFQTTVDDNVKTAVEVGKVLAGTLSG